jgi:hypothetical protein
MPKYLKSLLSRTVFILLLALPLIVSAHQPRIVDINNVKVLITDPEISKAYYDTLSGLPRIYHIDSLAPFELFLQISVPANSNPDGRYSVTVYKINGTRAQLAKLDADSGPWTPFFEPFGYDNYFQGPQFKQKLPSGTYEVEVYGNSNQGSYTLAIGETESFPLVEIITSLQVIPELKSTFFHSSPATFLGSPFGIGYLLAMLALACLFSKVCRWFFMKHSKTAARKAPKNISTAGRWIRFGIGIMLLIYTIFTSWNPFLLFFSFFLIVQARTCWCVVYAIMGKNYCEKTPKKE